MFKVGDVGSFRTLMKNEDFAELMKEVGVQESDFDVSSPKASDKSKDDDEDGDDGDGAKEDLDGKGGKKDGDGDLVEEEEREEGEVAWSVYFDYLRAAKAKYLFVFTIAFTISGNLTQVLNDMWLTWWTQDSFGLEQWQYQILYLLSSLLYALCTFGSAMVFAYVGIYGSQNLHIQLLHDILGRKQSFYDTTP